MSIIFFTIAILLASYIYLKSKELRIYNISGEYQLPWYERSQFTFRVSFPTRETAEKCATLVTAPKLTSTIEITPNAQRWAVTWHIYSFSSGNWYKELSFQILRSAVECGLEDPTIIASASKPNSGTAIILANYTVESMLLSTSQDSNASV